MTREGTRAGKYISVSFMTSINAIRVISPVVHYNQNGFDLKRSILLVCRI